MHQANKKVAQSKHPALAAARTKLGLRGASIGSGPGRYPQVSWYYAPMPFLLLTDMGKQIIELLTHCPEVASEMIEAICYNADRMVPGELNKIMIRQPIPAYINARKDIIARIEKHGDLDNLIQNHEDRKSVV